MGSFEWMELQTLTSDINASRARLTQARSNKDHRLIRVLETEISTAEQRRDRLLADISTHLAGAPEPIIVVKKKEPDPPAAAPAEPVAGAGAEPPPAPETTAAPEQGGISAPAAQDRGSATGGIVVWDKLTPADLERAQSELGARRTVMLARHAEELQALEGDQQQLASLEQAVAAFLRRFNAPAGDVAAVQSVVKLGEERESRAQVRA